MEASITDNQTTPINKKIIFPASKDMVREFEKHLNAYDVITQLVNLDTISDVYEAYYMVMTYDTQPVGAVTIQRHIEDYESCEIYKLYVLPEYRGRSIGKELVRRAMAEMKGRGFKELNVERTALSYEFWEKMKAIYPHDETLNGTEHIEFYL